jgi:lipopolysaccharide transport system ATP-binding protein
MVAMSAEPVFEAADGAVLRTPLGHLEHALGYRTFLAYWVLRNVVARYLYCSLMGLRTWQIRARLDEIAAFADIGDHLDVAFKRYSAGMMARLGFAAALHVDPGILLLDEVLAVGDHQFSVKSLAALRQVVKRCTVVFVSHSMESVNDICRRAIWLDGGRVRADGPAAEVTAAYLAAQRPAAAPAAARQPGGAAPATAGRPGPPASP